MIVDKLLPTDKSGLSASVWQPHLFSSPPRSTRCWGSWRPGSSRNSATRRKPSSSSSRAKDWPGREIISILLLNVIKPSESPPWQDFTTGGEVSGLGGRRHLAPKGVLGKVPTFGHCCQSGGQKLLRTHYVLARLSIWPCPSNRNICYVLYVLKVSTSYVFLALKLDDLARIETVIHQGNIIDSKRRYSDELKTDLDK